MELVQEHFVNWEQAKLQSNSPMVQLTVKVPVLKMETLDTHTKRQE